MRYNTFMTDLTFATFSTVAQDKKGLLLIDKDKGWTSHDVVAKVRSITGVKKVGHAGTLDPLATGLLIVLVGREYTKLQDQFMKQDKEYEVEVVFGQTTDSYDAMGEVMTKAPWAEVKKIEEDDLVEKMAAFQGKIIQTVPAYSAVKVKGRKLYEKARKGTLDLNTLPSREVEIYECRVDSFDKNEDTQTLKVTMYAKVSSGTYIRSLVHDIGKAIGVGAYVENLRRISIGEIDVKKALTLSDSISI
jgi:tRNA pseudouridine55 synthase